MAGILRYEPPFDHTKITDNFGYVFSAEDAYRLLADFEIKTKTKFSCLKADKSFDNIGKLVPERIFQQDYRDCKKITMFRVQLASRDFLFVF